MNNESSYSPKRNSTKELRPVRISGLVEPIEGDEGYDGGIGLFAVEKDELMITIPAWVMALRDECRLHWNDHINPIKVKIINSEDQLNKDIDILLRKGEVPPGPVRVYYKIKSSNQTAEPSRELKVLVKYTRPGGELTQPEPDGHPHLQYQFVPDVSGGINQSMVDKGIRLVVSPYPNMTIFDRLVARWGDSETAVFYPVTQRNIDDPINHPIAIFFSKELIERAGKGTHSVTFQVIDRCGNYPHSNAPWAIPTKVSVTLDDSTRLEPPEINDENGYLDPTFMEHITVQVPKSGLVVGSVVHVLWYGRETRQTIEKTYHGGETLDFAIPAEWARESDGSRVTIRYKVGGRESEPRLVDIKTTIGLAPPKVLEAYGAAGDRLKMDDIYRAKYVTIRIEPYVGMAAGQTIRVSWAATRFTYNSEIITVDAVGPIDHRLSRYEVVDAIGSAVKLNFTVRVYSKGPLHRSPPLNLTVDPQEFVLTPPRLTADRSKVTIRYPGMATGYWASVRVIGDISHDTAWQDLETGVTAEFDIPAEWLEGAKLINYRINRRNIKENSQFSQLLRLEANQSANASLQDFYISAPKVIEAPNGVLNVQKHAYSKDYIEVEVPHYQGMAIGHTLRVRWMTSRNIYKSETLTVSKVGPQRFRIPRADFIDAIGGYAFINCSLRTASGSPLIFSAILTLTVEKQVFNLVEPRYYADQNRVTVKFLEMTSGYTVRVRWAGVTVRNTESRPITGTSAMSFSIPEAWKFENRGRTVIVNYSVLKSGSTDLLMFSQVLKVHL